MKVYYGTDEFKSKPNAIVTSGTFDGVHQGHQKIINRLKEIAKKENGETVLLTFHPHPRHVLFPDDNTLRLLNSIDEKIELLDQMGIDHLIIQSFTKDFSRLTSLEFVRNHLVNQINTKKLIIGYDHHFGRNREGSFDHLMEYGPVYGFDVEEIPALDVDTINVSSTKIRKALTSGDIETANNYLGHPYRLTGNIIKGKQLGRTIGIPTANLRVNDANKLIPMNGVYVVQVVFNEEAYQGVMNIGVNPTVSEDRYTTKIEVHMLNFNQEIYEHEIKIDLLSRLRDEKKFESTEQLKDQINVDISRTKAFFK